MRGGSIQKLFALSALAVQLSGCLVGPPFGARGPQFEPHTQATPGTAIVYLYQYQPTLGETDSPTAIHGGYGRTGLLIFVNGQKAAPFIFGGYTVVEVEPGALEIEVRYPEAVAARWPGNLPPLPSLNFTAYPNERYYVWARTVFMQPPLRPIPPGGVNQPELVMDRAPEDLALRHLKRLRRQESYL